MSLHPLWPHQSRVLEEIHYHMNNKTTSMVVSSATGTGKSEIMFRLLQWAAKEHLPAITYCNRRLLFDQLGRGLYDSGITHGVRAAGHRANLSRDMQLAMIQTERSRVLKESSRELHKAKLVLIDEAHLMANGASFTIIKRHKQAGAIVIGFSATPVDVGHIYDEMIYGATTPEGRQCGALLPAKCFAPDMPDRRFIKKMKTGEEMIDGKLQNKWVSFIFGRVLEHWRIYNPERRPTILFAPGVDESKWFAQQFERAGVSAAHIDAKGVWVDGRWHDGDSARADVLERIGSGDLEVLSNRFVLREGIDRPELYHVILATKFGSETTYVQAVGRGLRNHPSLPGEICVQDHGANFWFHGSPNMARQWELTDNADRRGYEFIEGMRENQIREPARCPRCAGIRRGLGVCPYCGYEIAQETRCVVQLDGSLREMTGKMFKPRRKASPDAVRLWLSTYWSHYKKGKTFRQAFSAFAYKHEKTFGHFAWPQPDWPGMPRYVSDHCSAVRDVPFESLHGDRHLGASP